MRRQFWRLHHHQFAEGKRRKTGRAWNYHMVNYFLKSELDTDTVIQHRTYRTSDVLHFSMLRLLTQAAIKQKENHWGWSSKITEHTSLSTCQKVQKMPRLAADRSTLCIKCQNNKHKRGFSALGHADKSDSTDGILWNKSFACLQLAAMQYFRH